MYMDVFEQAAASSVTSLSPVSFERGKQFQVTFRGLEASPLTRVAFALPGECNLNLHSVRAVASDAPVCVCVCVCVCNMCVCVCVCVCVCMYMYVCVCVCVYIYIS